VAATVAEPIISASAFSDIPQTLVPVADALKLVVDKFVPCLINGNPTVDAFGVNSVSLIS